MSGPQTWLARILELAAECSSNLVQLLRSAYNLRISHQLSGQASALTAVLKGVFNNFLQWRVQSGGFKQNQRFETAGKEFIHSLRVFL
jgi:hypothetical protein